MEDDENAPVSIHPAFTRKGTKREIRIYTFRNVTYWFTVFDQWGWPKYFSKGKRRFFPKEESARKAGVRIVAKDEK
jgi:hypothetical protein